MTDYLFIDTERARAAAQHLRTMEAAADALVADVRQAASLAALIDTSTSQLGGVADAISNLARILDERSDAAESGGMLPYQGPVISVSDVSDALASYAPFFGTRSTEPEPDRIGIHTGFGFGVSGDIPGVGIDVDVDIEVGIEVGIEISDVTDTLIDWIHDAYDPITPQPIFQEPVETLWEDVTDLWGSTESARDWIGNEVESAADRAWDEVEQRGADAWDEVQSLGDDFRDRVDDIDWSPVGRFIDRYNTARESDNLLLQSLGPPGHLLETLTYYGPVVLAVDTPFASFAIGRSNAGGESQFAFGWGFGMPHSLADAIPGVSLMLTPSSTPQESGDSANTTVCRYACVGTTGDPLDPDISIGVGTPGASAGITHMEWVDMGPSNAD